LLSLFAAEVMYSSMMIRVQLIEVYVDNLVNQFVLSLFYEALESIASQE